MTTLEERIELYTRQGDFDDLVKLLEDKINEVKSLDAKLHLEYQLAEAYYSKRDFNKAKNLAEGTLLVLQDHENHLMEGNVENLLGKIYRIHQRYSEALVHYQKAERAFKSAKSNIGLSKVYHNFGNVYIFIERFKDAKKFHFKALKLTIREGKQEFIASSHLNIGSMFYQNGEVDQAISHFFKARDLLEEIQYIPSLATTYHNLAEAFLLRRDYNAAQKNSSKAVSLYEIQKNSLGQRLALTTLARSEKAAGLLDKAIETYSKTLTLNTTEEALLELSECYLKQDQTEKAKKTLEMILELPTRTSRGLGYSLDYLARIAIDKREFDEARKIYNQLLAVLINMKPQDHESIASTQGNLGYMHLKLGNIKRSWEHLVLARDSFKKSKSLGDLFILGCNYRDELVAKKDYQHAIMVIQEFIIPTVIKYRKRSNENQYHYEIALLYHFRGKTKEGLHYWKKNHNNKRDLQKYSTPLLASVLDLSTKSELEKQHLSFLKQLLSATDFKE